MLPILMFMLYTQIILVMLEVFGKDQRLRFWSLIDSVPIMMLMRQLESLCGLASACPNEKAKATLLDTHCQSMVAQMKGLTLTHDDVKGFSEALKTSVFTEDQVATLVAAASDSLLKAAAGQPARKATQKLVDLRPYLTQSEVASFQGPASLSVKIHLAVQCCMRVGLTNPSEPAAGTILKMIQQFNTKELADPQTFLNSLQLLKQQFKAERKKVGKEWDDLYVLEYNGIPKDLPQQVFQRAFSKEPPSEIGGHAPLAPGGPLRINNNAIAGRRNGQADSMNMTPMFTFASMVQNSLAHLNQAICLGHGVHGHAHGHAPLGHGHAALGNGHAALAHGNTCASQAHDAQPLAIEDLRGKAATTTPALPVETKEEEPEVVDTKANKSLSPAEQAQCMLSAWEVPQEQDAGGSGGKARGRGRGRGRGGGRGRGRGRGKGKGKVVEDDSKMIMKSKNTKNLKPMKTMKVKDTPKQTMKRPSASTLVRGVKHVGKEVSGVSWEERLKRRPHGCASCRWKPGCCPSCWK